MGPTILLDKSAFQALAADEMHKITTYFQWNRVDILLAEIISDLSKKTKTSSSRNEASILADKVSLTDSVENANYIQLCLGNLVGANFVMDGRPIIAPTTIGRLEDGRVGALLDETGFCEMIYRWQRGDFGKQEEMFADFWRRLIADRKVDGYLNCLASNHIIIPESRSVEELVVEIGRLLQNPSMQSVFLDMFLSYQDVDRATKRNIRNRLRQCPYSLSYVAPYAFYCLKVFVLFLGANKFSLISKQPTDRIDLEYLFYLPFCHVFSSNDTLHKRLCPALMRRDQVFLSGDDLKKGMQELETLPKHEETMNAKCTPIPPMPRESIIRDAWIRTGWLYD
jgi:hypothetical protein